MLSKIVLPQRVEPTNIDQLIAQFKDDTENQKVLIVDLSSVEYITPTGLVATVAYLKKWRSKKEQKQIKFIYPSECSNALSYMARMNFFTVVGENFTYPYTVRTAEDRLCEITEIKSASEAGSVINRIMGIIETRTKISSGLSTSVGEIIDNAFHHSSSELPCYVCAQYYPNLRKVEVAIVDCGIGYRGSLSRVHRDLKDDKHAIKLALQKNVTGNIENNKRLNTGLGLYVTKKIIEMNRGKMLIYTGKGMCIIEKTENFYDVPKWGGTLVSLEFNTEIGVDVKKIFDEMEGENFFELDDSMFEDL
ncbi:ATP-binding region ATPase domain protein [Caldicellulosiruptor acetigenus I77R1B]|uniref:ATP-binding region ATPase domain protein n=1 Tax=Caldicellulosiruptor acetigenus (strain ATCC 700853 / DSM 12137 / I77R1B) TaxID=632335 RepID=E4S5U1_CALA7|nr:ATP-binding protein [Caldicellulosiruptor acetigenus]ADQ41601.1 ATP-binding region ATPase domain protein [Caldicellulosiruptor acetigenus I77R1B]